MASKTDLAGVKMKLNGLFVVKLMKLLAGLSKHGNVVDNYVVFTISLFTALLSLL